ncbi:MAG: cyclic 2,3-diphosphoglycerate synthase [Actinomycetota bacterium]
MTRAVVVVDGEHYPPVTQQALEAVRARGLDVVAAVFAGGGEKLSRPVTLDVPIVRSPNGAVQALTEAITAYAPDVVFDVSDDPVVDSGMREQLIAITLARGVVYEAPGLRMEPQLCRTRSNAPTIAVIGSGKRCGKTALSAHVARTLAGAGMRVVIVAMGRGGPEKPVLVRGDVDPPDARALLAIADGGQHAASDVYEDAVVARLPVVGARRAGAGPSGSPIFDTVSEAVALAETLDPDVIVVEGSGTAVPPVGADATLLVVRDSDDPSNWPVCQRILLADLVVVRMQGIPGGLTSGEEPLPSKIPAGNPIAFSIRDPALPVVYVSLCPTPLASIAGRRVMVATTAPAEAEQAVRAHLEQTWGAHVTGYSSHLADRDLLLESMAANLGKYDVLLCEIKAAAVDVAVRTALEAAADVVFLDNRPFGEQFSDNNHLGRTQSLEEEILSLAHVAQSRFHQRNH